MSTTEPSNAQAAIYATINRYRCQERQFPNGFVLRPPLDDPLPKWNLWNDLDCVKAIIIGLLHSDSELGPDALAAILHARNPSAYGDMTGKDVELIFSWLRNNPEAPKNPYKTMFNRQPEDEAKSNVYVVTRASILLGLLETEAGIPRATEKAQERMAALVFSAKVLDEWDAMIKEVKDKEERDAEQERERKQESAEKSKETETREKEGETAGTDDE